MKSFSIYEFLKETSGKESIIGDKVAALGERVFTRLALETSVSDPQLFYRKAKRVKGNDLIWVVHECGRRCIWSIRRITILTRFRLANRDVRSANYVV